MYYIYMLRCKDNSIYTGIITNIERRIRNHMSKVFRGKFDFLCKTWYDYK